MLATVSHILASRHERVGESQDLEEAISRMRTAVRIQSTKGEVSLLAIMFNNLGGLLFRRYGCAGRKEDLKEAEDGLIG